MQSEESEEARDDKGGSEMFWMWEEGTQKVGVFKNERKKEGESSTTKRGVRESKETQQSKRATPKGSSNVHGGVDNIQRGSYLCGMLGV